jgi:hypothetical protein
LRRTCRRHEKGEGNDFLAVIPLHPRVSASFSDLAGYMHPHSLVRMPNGNVIATFQHALGRRDAGS